MTTKTKYRFEIKCNGYYYGPKYRQNLKNGKDFFEAKAQRETQSNKRDVTLIISKDTGERTPRKSVIWEEIERIEFPFKAMPLYEVDDVLVLNEYGQEEEEYEGMLEAKLYSWELDKYRDIVYKFLVTFDDGRRDFITFKKWDLENWTKKETINV